MTLSGTEFSTLAKTAALGAGLPPFQASLFGEIALSHMLAGRDAKLLIAALEETEAGMVNALFALEIAARADPQQKILAPRSIPPDLLKSFVECRGLRIIERAGSDHAIVPADGAVLPPRGRVQENIALMSCLKALAEQTFVPDTQQSRALGAGAGSDDKD